MDLLSTLAGDFGIGRIAHCFLRANNQKWVWRAQGLSGFARQTPLQGLELSALRTEIHCGGLGSDSIPPEQEWLRLFQSFGTASSAACCNDPGRRRRDRCWQCCHSGATR